MNDPDTPRIQFGSLSKDELDELVDYHIFTRKFDYEKKWSTEDLFGRHISSASISLSATPTITDSSANSHDSAQTSTGAIAAQTSIPPIPEAEHPIQSPPSAPKSWASLVQSNLPKQTLTVAPISLPPPRTSFEKFFKSYTPQLTPTPVHPRGLINTGNMCFMNAILQPLVACAPFFGLMESLKAEVAKSGGGFGGRSNAHGGLSTPVLDTLICFFNEFEKVSASTNKKRRPASDPLDAGYIYDALRAKLQIDSIKGRQEDAEEFLGFLLDGLHEELLLLRNGSSSSPTSSKPNGTAANSSSPIANGGVSPNGDSGWVEVGPKNRTAITRTTEIKESPIVHIFGGRMRSTVKATGDKESVTLEPFQSLQLDIGPENVNSIEDALLNLTVPETIQGFTSRNLGIPVEASKQNYIDLFPPILILHLKRFLYTGEGGTQKLRKRVSFGTSLKIKPEIASPALRKGIKYLEYSLFAVVNHHGKFLEGGHYTCDIRRSNDEWIRFDDEYFERVTSEEVTSEREDREPYMLFFAKS